ncbi:MAG: phenylalanine--tRNA ligase subunit beta [Thermodesulfobacteriota bacterium]
MAPPGNGMKFTINWLKEYVDTPLSPAAVADGLTMRGLEVESISHLAPALDNVVVGQILEVSRHPSAERLALCRVAIEGTALPVVCGAANARPGLLAPLALPEAVLADGRRVSAVEIRGRASAGMLCSAKELGLGDDATGLLELPPTCRPGQPLATALGLDDWLIEVDLTPNRPDCASVIGIAREVAALTGQRLVRPQAAAELPAPSADLPFAVEIQAPEHCPRYAARLITGVRIGPSPWWLQLRLRAVGVRPINNIVDVTNLVLMELGQPLHAFDFQRIAGGRIVVRTARVGEAMVTLDGARRQLDAGMLLITDPERPVALAGIMGGESSEVTASTTEVLLESAFFEPTSIRRTARVLKMSTEASYRFERGVDFGGVVPALQRATALMADLAGGQPRPGGVDCCPRPRRPVTLGLRVARTNTLLGTTLTAGEIRTTLARIEVASTQVAEDRLAVTPPSFRVDLEREIDLIEEVARVVGYETIGASLPRVPLVLPEATPDRPLRREAASILTALGFCEAVNYSFTDKRYCEWLELPPQDPRRCQLPLLNPLAEDQGVLRTSLLPGLFSNVRHNLNRQTLRLRLFEVGKVFFAQDGKPQPQEGQRLAAVLTGPRWPRGQRLHGAGDEGVDVFDVKGVAEALIQGLGLATAGLVASQEPLGFAVPESLLAVVLPGGTVGHLGQVAPPVADRFGIRQPVFFLDLDLDALVAAERHRKAFAALPRFPAVNWDLALVVADEVPAGAMVAGLIAAGEPLVEAAELFDVYRGKPLAPGEKSVAISVTYRAPDRTLGDLEVEKVHRRLADRMVTLFGGRLRETTA